MAQQIFLLSWWS